MYVMLNLFVILCTKLTKVCPPAASVSFDHEMGNYYIVSTEASQTHACMTCYHALLNATSVGSG